MDETLAERVARVIKDTAEIEWAYVSGTDDREMYIENADEVAKAVLAEIWRDEEAEAPS